MGEIGEGRRAGRNAVNEIKINFTTLHPDEKDSLLRTAFEAWKANNSWL